MKDKKYSIIFICIITTFIFCVLYSGVIWGEQTNIYMDIGADTLYLIYPRHLFRKQGVSGYILSSGFGEYISGSWFEMLPFNWVQLVVNDIVVANCISLYLQYMVTAIFAYLFFSKLMKQGITRMVCTLFWTFSGYMVLWGQHGNSVNIAYFTAIMYLIQCLLCKERKGFALVIPFSLLGLYSYYFFYMVGLFTALYVVGYCIIKKFSIRDCIKKLVELLCVGAMSFGIAAVGIIPSLRKFFVSARVMVPEQRTQGVFHDSQYMLSVVGRFISNDIFGTGNSYTGYYNYYEAAMLVCSALFIPSIVVLVRTKKYRKPIIILFIIAIVALSMPIFSYIFNLDARKPRWTYMLVLLMILCIGYCVDNVINYNIQVKISDIFIVGIIYSTLFIILLWADRSGLADVKRNPFLLAIMFTVFYFFILLYLHKRMACVVLLIMATAEMIVNNYPAINNRIHVTEKMLAEGLYNDGTKDVLEHVSGDKGVYRINKTYDSVFYNDALVQGYNGLGIYDPTNSQSLIDYYQVMGFSLLNGKIHYVRIGVEHSIINTLLGVKYVIAREGDMVPDNYSLIYSLNGKSLYYNEQTLGFGYIYNKEISKAQFEDVAMQERGKILTRYYFRTENGSVSENRDLDLDGIDVKNELKELKENSAYNTVFEKDALRFDIYNSYDCNAMLCVPIVFDVNWCAYVDGEKRNCVNINGGLLGVDMSDCDVGKYSIVLKYDAKDYKYGAIISLISIFIYVGMVLFLRFHKTTH